MEQSKSDMETFELILSKSIADLALLKNRAIAAQRRFFEEHSDWREAQKESAEDDQTPIEASNLAIRVTRSYVTNRRDLPELTDLEYVRLSIVRCVNKGNSKPIRLIRGEFDAERICSVRANRVAPSFAHIVKRFVEKVKFINSLTDLSKGAALTSANTIYLYTELTRRLAGDITQKQLLSELPQHPNNN